jgi:hypothetical protein
MSIIYCVCKHILYGLLIGFNKNINNKISSHVYMGFLNYNIIFDIDISNYETDYTKICRAVENRRTYRTVGQNID